jgi:hypothetical protein
MRLIFGLLSLLVVLAVVGLLAKTQLASLRSTPVAMPGATDSAASAGDAAPPGQQIQQKIRDDMDKLMQQSMQRNDATQ